MKKLFLALVLCCIAGVASAQYVETVHLKNGGIIHGIIIEQIPNEKLKIQTRDGNVFVYTFDEIEKITKEVPTRHQAPAGFHRSNSNWSLNPKYQGSVDVGYSLGVGFWKFDRVEFSTSHGCLINPYIYVGAGVGVHYFYNVFDSSAVSVPIFADFRGNFLQGELKPFVNFRIGYSVADTDGLYLSPSVGVSFKRFDISVGYSYQSTPIVWGEWDETSAIYYKDSVNLGAITFKVGVRF